ncbi:uncharacterized protein LY89DRAFT_672408 [Mollisia scopiformis]|uniref:Uncharacterized protein n=1 Tax=Mollisia scopiformis TaxID=149040 RepID=A0A194WYX9_MOLSC|nr:uncharacterized protein LY89DRAFT_672408 [Mollisia scopiformis]KUJ13168.1 hypothetical protein LY89DRAFT_672408 [Mollisia scopiformis]
MASTAIHTSPMYHRFHNIAEDVIYRQNTFEIWDSDLWFDGFIYGLSPFARNNPANLRVQWPIPPTERPEQILGWIAHCSGVKRLEFFCFSQRVSISALQFLDRLPIENIWFETSTCQVPNLAALRYPNGVPSRHRIHRMVRAQSTQTDINTDFQTQGGLEGFRRE